MLLFSNSILIPSTEDSAEKMSSSVVNTGMQIMPLHLDPYVRRASVNLKQQKKKDGQLSTTLLFDRFRVDHCNRCIKFEFKDEYVYIIQKTLIWAESVCQPI